MVRLSSRKWDVTLWLANVARAYHHQRLFIAQPGAGTVHRLELDSWLTSTSRSFDAPHFCSSLSRSNPLRSGSATSSKLNTAPSYVNGCRKLHPLLTFSLWPRRSCRQSLLRQNLPPWWIQLTKFAQCHSTLLKYAISKLDDFSPPLLPAFSKLLPLSLIVSFSGKLPDF